MTPVQRILIVDDEAEIRRALEIGLRTRGYDVQSAANGEVAIESAAVLQPDLVILDIALPDISGLEVCRRLRQWSSVPIIILSVCSHEKDKIAALDSGADDYVTKPFSMGELLARMRATFRRVQGDIRAEPVSFESGGVHIDFVQRRVTVKGEEVKLTPKEYDLLNYFVTHVDRIATHRQLLSAVWGEEFCDDKPLLRVHIANLRQKIEPLPARPTYILNEPGVGYRFRTP